MTGMKAMRDYILYANRPITSSQIVVELGISYQTVKKYMQELVTEGFVRQIGKDKGKNVYIHNKTKGKSAPYKVNQKHYTLESVQEAYRRQIQNRREEFDSFLEAL